MWEFLPIQTAHLKGQPFTIIQPDFPYPRSPDVRVSTWKDVPAEIQEWARTICEDCFHCVRNPASPEDLFAWIPGVGTLLAKPSRWIDSDRSFPVVFVQQVYVHPGNRGQKVTEKLVTSLCHEAVLQWGIQAFAFELESVPSSLVEKQAIPFLTFDYMWIPFWGSDEEWRPLSQRELKRCLRNVKGFHPSSYTGWRAYEHPSSKKVVVLDAHDDIVHYDSFRHILQCNIPRMRGAYVRVFAPIGTCHVFVENLYFRPSVGEHRLV